jgi:hypothetical protein
LSEIEASSSTTEHVLFEPGSVGAIPCRLPANDEARQKPQTDPVVDDVTRLHIQTWRDKAEELRTIADGIKNEQTRQLLLNAAANYERLADQAEKASR